VHLRVFFGALELVISLALDRQKRFVASIAHTCPFLRGNTTLRDALTRDINKLLIRTIKCLEVSFVQGTKIQHAFPPIIYMFNIAEDAVTAYIDTAVDSQTRAVPVPHTNFRYS